MGKPALDSREVPFLGGTRHPQLLKWRIILHQEPSLLSHIDSDREDESRKH